jgi:hypothetical protein
MACYALPAPLASRDLQAAFVLRSDLRAAEGGDMTTRGRPFRSLTKRPKGATSPRYGRKAAGRASSELQAIVTLFTPNLSPPLDPGLAALQSRVICEFCHLDSRSQNDRVGSCGRVGQKLRVLSAASTPSPGKMTVRTVPSSRDRRHRAGAQAFGARAIPIARNRRNAESASQMTDSVPGKRRSRYRV